MRHSPEAGRETSVDEPSSVLSGRFMLIQPPIITQTHTHLLFLFRVKQTFNLIRVKLIVQLRVNLITLHTLTHGGRTTTDTTEPAARIGLKRGKEEKKI